MENQTNSNQRFFEHFQHAYKASAIYRVRGGDTLANIIWRYYHISISDRRYNNVLLHVQHMNKLKDPNVIYPGRFLRLPPLSSPHEPLSYCSINDNSSLYEIHHKEIETLDNVVIGAFSAAHSLERLAGVLPQQQSGYDLFWALSWLHENYDYLSISAGAGFNTWGNLVAQGNRMFIEEVKTAYQQYKSGTITKGQYDYRRRLALKKFSDQVGPFEKFLMKGKTSAEAIRISQTRALPPTGKIDQHLGRLSKMANIAKHGGLVLTAAGGAMGCYNMAHTHSKQEKNEIFVETVASSLVGLTSSMAVTLVLASNPVGWGVALVLGVGAAVGSYAAGKGAVKFYNQHYREIDLATLSGANALCR